jgi:hypothetical protein
MTGASALIENSARDVLLWRMLAGGEIMRIGRCGQRVREMQ